MGTSASTSSTSATSDAVFPVYYIEGVTDKVVPEDIELAEKSWKMLVDDSAPSWQRKKATQEAGGSGAEEGSISSHLDYFTDCFYERLFDVHPACRPLFKNSIKAQGKALVGMLNVAVSVLRAPDKLIPALEKLAVRHVKYGVKANQYGTVGEVLLWTLNHCLEESFTDRCRTAWLRIYCLMLKFIIPAALTEEDRMRNHPTEEEVLAMSSRKNVMEQALKTSDVGSSL